MIRNVYLAPVGVSYDVVLMADAMQPDSEPLKKNPFERFLLLFSNVAAGEGGTVLLLTLNAFIMMALYYILKPVREGLILSGFGAVIKSYSSAFQALLFIVVVPAYGAFAARVNRVWLLSGMSATSVPMYSHVPSRKRKLKCPSSRVPPHPIVAAPHCPFSW